MNFQTAARIAAAIVLLHIVKLAKQQNSYSLITLMQMLEPVHHNIYQNAFIISKFTIRYI